MTGSRRKTRDDVGMNLFPFLAVLICTMGSLIMLLVVMVQQARVCASEAPPIVEAERDRASDLQQQRLAELDELRALAEQKQQEIDDFQWQASILRPSYEKTVEQLAEQRLVLSHLEAHTRELSEKASKMQTEADLIAVAATEGASIHEDTKEDIQRLRDSVASAKQDLEAEHEKLGNHTTKYALVPYEGASGTNRPPIYVECLADRVILQPENVVLLGEDFREPLTNSNPLALALRAKREFMLERGLIDQDAEPYPLLIVRPGAAASYAAARSAMTSWEAEFGYELIEGDIELDYQPADPRLTTLLNDIVEEARGRRSYVRSIRPRRAGPPELLRPSLGGGFETVSGRSRSSASGEGGSSVNGYGTGTEGGDPFGNASQPSGSATNGTRSSTGNGGGWRGGETNQVGAGGHRVGGHRVGGNGAGGYRDGADDANSAAQSQNESTNRLRSSNGFRGNRFDADPAAAGSTGPSGSANTGSREAAHGGGGTSTTASGSGGNGSSGSGGGGQAGSKSTSMSAGFESSQSLSKTRGNNWALPHSQSDAVGIKRPINVICDGDRLVLVPEKGTRQELQIFRHDGSLPAVIDPFVDAVQTRLESWGIAGQGIYWRPVLQVQLNDNAVGKYRELLQLLDNSGIEVTREP